MDLNILYTLYCYTSPSNKKYIGVTCRELSRKSGHKRKEHVDSDTTKFANAIKKYGFKNFKYEILTTTKDKDHASELERFYIKQFNTIENGYNILSGGYDGFDGIKKYSNEKILEIIEDLKENILSYTKISKKHNVSITLISEIKNGKQRNNEMIERSILYKAGSENPAAKLTDELVKQIKNDLATGVPRKQIQKKYDVSKTLIQKIAVGEAWSHIESDYKYVKKETNGNAKLDRQAVSELKKDMRGGNYKVKELCEKYNISMPTFYQIKRGRTWVDVE